MAHKGLPNKKIRCVRTTMMARSTSSHVRPDRLARTKVTIPFEFPCVIFSRSDRSRRVIAGFIRIVLRRQMTTIYSGSIAMTIVGVVILVLGGYLSFEGYRPVSN